MELTKRRVAYIVACLGLGALGLTSSELMLIWKRRFADQRPMLMAKDAMRKPSITRHQSC